MFLAKENEIKATTGKMAENITIDMSNYINQATRTLSVWDMSKKKISISIIQRDQNGRFVGGVKYGR